MEDDPRLGLLWLEIQELYATQRRLKAACELGLDYTLDGKLVGDLGNQYASIAFGLELFLKEAGKVLLRSIKSPERIVEVHTTQRESSIYLGHSQLPDCHLLAFRLNARGEFDLLYNGPHRFRGEMQIGTLRSHDINVFGGRLIQKAQTPVFCSRLLSANSDFGVRPMWDVDNKLLVPSDDSACSGTSPGQTQFTASSDSNPT